MKKTILPLLMAVTFVGKVTAQSSKIFAITGETQKSITWNAIREINGNNGTFKTTLYTPKAESEITYQTFGNKQLTPNNEPAINTIAATAYDAKNNRLYYTNMHGNTLNYIDLNVSNFTVVSNNDAAFITGDKNKSDAAVITRMTFAADGAGYALTNDAEHLIRFTTSGIKQSITDLGRLIDNKNDVASVHLQCTSWGGDMVGDAYGNLYLITMRNTIYKINTQTLITDYVGAIKGLPAEFTTNGAAVNNEGDLILSSASYTESYFKVNIGSLDVIESIKSNEGVYSTSDLASANLLYQSKAMQLEKNIAGSFENISIYPNPIQGKLFQLKISNPSSTDKYNIQVNDIYGKAILVNNAAASNETLKINLPIGTTTGLYFLKITNTTKQTIYNEKLIVN